MPEALIKEQSLLADREDGLSGEAILRALEDALSPVKGRLKKILLVPPDFTRLHSGAGQIAALLYGILGPSCRVDVLPALGTHVKMSREEWETMYSPIPFERMLVHNWRTDVVTVGEIEAGFVAELSEGLMNEPIPVEINRHLLDPEYDLILSIGQVVPHEVAGMANHAKNIFVGCGGARMINASHMLGALFGMERIMGREQTPVRALFDRAAERFLQKLPLGYILTVTDAPQGQVRIHGLFTGSGRRCFEEAARLSARVNMQLLDRPISKAVVYLDGQEFKSTWLGNKAIYRTRMAMADGGELVILAPGVEKFGEDEAVDRLIRAYGYSGRQSVLKAVKESEALRQNLSAAAHLIHGSSEGRFKVTYCAGHLTRDEIERAGFAYLDYDQAIRRYPPQRLHAGWNSLEGGEEIFYIPNPALGLWALKSHFEPERPEDGRRSENQTGRPKPSSEAEM